MPWYPELRRGQAGGVLMTTTLSGATVRCLPEEVWVVLMMPKEVKVGRDLEET